MEAAEAAAFGLSGPGHSQTQPKPRETSQAASAAKLIINVSPARILTFRSAMDVRHIDQVPAFRTKDGSEIRELLAHRNSCIRKQSLAEARLDPGASTTPHYHPQTEEIYYILTGQGRMRIDADERDVAPGDAIAIPPGAVHTIANVGKIPLIFLCCCAPAYEHADTVLVESACRQ